MDRSTFEHWFAENDKQRVIVIYRVSSTSQICRYHDRNYYRQYNTACQFLFLKWKRNQCTNVLLSILLCLTVFYYDQTSGIIWWKKKIHGNGLTLFCSSHVAVFQHRSCLLTNREKYSSHIRMEIKCLIKLKKDIGICFELKNIVQRMCAKIFKKQNTDQICNLLNFNTLWQVKKQYNSVLIAELVKNIIKSCNYETHEIIGILMWKLNNIQYITFLTLAHSESINEHVIFFSKKR